MNPAGSPRTATGSCRSPTPTQGDCDPWACRRRGGSQRRTESSLTCLSFLVKRLEDAVSGPVAAGTGPLVAVGADQPGGPFAVGLDVSTGPFMATSSLALRLVYHG